MTDRDLMIGIVFNKFMPVPPYTDQNLTDETVEETAREVFDLLASRGHSVFLIPLEDSFLDFLRRIRELRAEVIINLCEGFCGRPQLEANVAAALELIGVPFTGNSSRTLGLCQDKFKAKAVLHSHGLPTPRGSLLTSPDEQIGLPFPVIVKPNCEDASLGIFPDSVVFDEKNLLQKTREIMDSFDQPILVEEFIDGREFNIAILEAEDPRPLPVSEIDYSSMSEEYPRIISYEAKWFEEHELYKSTPPVCPALVGKSLKSELHQSALRAFRALDCQDYARVDFRMDGDENIFILEVNPNPDISRTAGYARALSAAHIDPGIFWEKMIDNALRRNSRPVEDR